MADAVIVVPCYNEVRRLDVAQFDVYVAAHPGVGFMLVDDASTDGTWDVLQAMRSRHPGACQSLRLERNGGKAEAVRQGVLQALQGEPRYVGFWDADLSTPLSAISDFVRFADTRPDIHMVYGARVKLLGRVVQRRALRHYFGRVLATAISVVLRLGVYDTQCGAKLFRLGPATRGLFERPFLSRWLFDVEILARWIQASKRGEVAPVRSVVYEYPLEQWIHRSGSKLRATDAFGALVDLVRIGQTYLWR